MTGVHRGPFRMPAGGMGGLGISPYEQVLCRLRQPGASQSDADERGLARVLVAGARTAALVSGLIAPQSPSEYRWETLWHYHQSGSEVFKGDMHFYRTDSEYRRASPGIDTADCPVFLMTGEYDYSCTPELTRETAARIAGAEAIIMDGIGHFPMSENPERFAAFLLPVLDRVSRGRAAP